MTYFINIGYRESLYNKLIFFYNKIWKTTRELTYGNRTVSRRRKFNRELQESWDWHQSLALYVVSEYNCLVKQCVEMSKK